MRTRVVLVMMAVGLIASGCFKVNFTIDVNEDGSGTLEGLTALNFEAIGGLLEDFGEDAGFSQDEICEGFEDDSGIDTNEFDTTRPYNEDGFCGVEFSETFDADEFSSVASALGDGSTSEEAILRQEPDGGWYFEVPFDAETFSTDDTDLLPGFDEIFGDAEYIMRVRLPGRQVEHNGEIDAEGFVVWDVDITNPPESLFLRTEPGEPITGDASVGGSSDDDGGNTAVVIIIVVVVLAALGLAAFFLMRNRGGNEGPPASGVAATVAGGAAPTTPPVDPNAPPTNAAPPVETTQPMPPVSPGATMPTTADNPAAAAAAGAAAAASPTREEATGAPVWDAARGKYVQWDPNANHWLVFDDATQSWNVEGS